MSGIFYSKMKPFGHVYHHHSILFWFIAYDYYDTLCCIFDPPTQLTQVYILCSGLQDKKIIGIRYNIQCSIV